MAVENHERPPVSEVLKNVVGIFGLRLNEEPRYEVKERIGDVEIREYKPYAIATTKVEGDHDEASRIAFQRLADYIFGKNAENKQLSMTAPVFQEKEAQVSEDYDFSKPTFFHERHGSGWLMSFVLPSKYTRSTAPRPLDDHITIEENIPGLVAVLSYSGDNTLERAEEKMAELSKWLLHHDKFDAMSEPRTAQYDAPNAISFLKKNEIHVSVAPKFARH
jgi:DNA gyrase inhibitor GyrI